MKIIKVFELMYGGVTLDLQAEFRVILAATQGKYDRVWLELDRSCPVRQTVRFEVLPTGAEIADWFEHAYSWQHDGHVSHLYYRVIDRVIDE